MKCFLFSGLSEAEIRDVFESADCECSFKKGEELYKVGYIGIMLSGSADIIRTGDSGNALTVREAHEDDVFGAASVFGEWKEGKSSIKAKTSCKVVYMSETTLRSIFSKYPSVAAEYIAFLSDRIRFLNRRIDAFTAESAVQKLYEYLVSLSDKDGVVSLDFGMAELARRLKMGRSSLYRSVSVLCESGLVMRIKTGFTVK